jgi:glucosamine-phosphate N-acetyltransferase
MENNDKLENKDEKEKLVKKKITKKSKEEKAVLNIEVPQVKKTKNVKISKNVKKETAIEADFNFEEQYKKDLELLEIKKKEADKALLESLPGMKKITSETIGTTEIHEDDTDSKMKLNKFMNETLSEIMKQMNNDTKDDKNTILSSKNFVNDTNEKTNEDEETKSQKIKTLEERGDFLDLRLIEPHDYYKGFLELLTEIGPVEPIDIIQFTTYVVNLHNNYKQIWVVEDKRYNIIIGSITLILENNLFNKMGKYCRIEDLVVHDGIRKCGLGRTLVNHILKIAREINCFRVILNCNEKNINFYENCGFQHDKVEMTIDITPTTIFRLERDIMNEPNPFDW